MNKLRMLLTLVVSIVSLLVVASMAHAGMTTYIYDDLDRIKEVIFPDGWAMQYNYDEIGNLTSKITGLSPCPAGYTLNQATTRSSGYVHPL